MEVITRGRHLIAKFIWKIAVTKISQKITALRDKLGLSRDAFARRLRIPARTVARWEDGENEPSGLYLEKIERMLKKHLEVSSVEKN